MKTQVLALTEHCPSDHVNEALRKLKALEEVQQKKELTILIVN